MLLLHFLKDTSQRELLPCRMHDLHKAWHHSAAVSLQMSCCPLYCRSNVQQSNGTANGTSGKSSNGKASSSSTVAPTAAASNGSNGSSSKQQAKPSSKRKLGFFEQQEYLVRHKTTMLSQWCYIPFPPVQCLSQR
eukprot:GHRR01035012.1.p1 GENE.GHRR01035012.1~~GHRR01035012.1.p1  ORF type:complete len:135 (-),score=54.54 GHRR01035012.1:532-936(-)